jgi:hypothetical protein
MARALAPAGKPASAAPDALRHSGSPASPRGMNRPVAHHVRGRSGVAGGPRGNRRQTGRSAMIVRSGASDADDESDEGLSALLYVSRVAVDPDRLAWTLADIQTVSVARNTAADITGLLIATPRYFAQFIEGPHASLDAVMARIMLDPRHREIRIVRDMPARRRVGGSWRLIRFEPGSFEERHVTPLLRRAHEAPDEPSGEALMGLVGRLIAARADPAGLPADRAGEAHP